MGSVKLCTLKKWEARDGNQGQKEREEAQAEEREKEEEIRNLEWMNCRTE